MDTQDFQRYLDELSLRMLRLESISAAELRNDVGRHETLKALFLAYQQEAQALRMQLLSAKGELAAAERAFAHVVSQWQDTAKQEDLARLQDRIDAWPLEFFETEKALKG